MYRSVFRSRPSGLWQNRDFLHFWSAETIAQFGFQLSVVAIPLIAAITLDATPLEMGVLAASGQLPKMLLGFVAGAIADRIRRRPLMIAMDLGRIVSSAIIPIAALTGAFSFWMLLAATVITGIQSVFFDTAWSATIPTLVERRELADANGKLMGSASLAQVLGPALGGLMVAAIGGVEVIWLTAIAFAGSAYFLSRIRKVEVKPARSGESRSIVADIREGLVEIWGSDIVRPLANSSLVLNFGGYIFLAVYVLFMTDDLGLSSRGVGFVFASGGVGALIGTLLASRMASTMGIGRAILLGSFGFGASNFLVPVAFYWKDGALPVVIISEFLAWFFLMVFNVNRFSLRQALTADHLRGRVSGSMQTLMSAMVVIGSLVGGAIGDVISVHAALWIGDVLMFVSAWWVWNSPVPAITRIPENPEAVEADRRAVTGSIIAEHEEPSIA